MEATRHNMICDAYRTHIGFGLYPKGTCPLVVSQLTGVCHAVNTARRAYFQLQREGRVCVSQGRRTSVAYSPAPACLEDGIRAMAAAAVFLQDGKKGSAADDADQ